MSTWLAAVELDEATLAAPGEGAGEERRAAIQALLHDNRFEPRAAGVAPFRLRLAAAEARLAFEVRDADGAAIDRFTLPVAALRAVMRDYFTVCQSYDEAIRSAGPARIETLDMARRALHDEAAELLMDRLADSVRMDRDTARRLFTLICALKLRF